VIFYPVPHTQCELYQSGLGAICVQVYAAIKCGRIIYKGYSKDL